MPAAISHHASPMTSAKSVVGPPAQQSDVPKEQKGILVMLVVGGDVSDRSSTWRRRRQEEGWRYGHGYIRHSQSSDHALKNGAHLWGVI